MPFPLIRLKAFATFSLVFAGLAAFGAKAAENWDEKIYNPKPAKDDVVLPMPCGGSMTFRPVLIPDEGVFSDYQIAIGANDAARGYSEGARTTHISGSFSQGKNQRYYLIGKYEVSQAQYDAVMSGECAKPTQIKRQPKTEIGWMEAMAFADSYNQWLLKNARNKLPKDGDETGFVRLPTETEWEFAARGGIAVSPSEFSDRVFPMKDGLARSVWHAGSQSAAGKVQLTGLLEPNPLGIHDILGNVDEMMFEPFHLNRLNRPHGQAGAFVIRGGNYLTAAEDVRSAYRHEVPYYDAEGPRRSKTTGLRLVLVAPVISSPARLKAFEAAWPKLGASSAPRIEESKPSDNPIEELRLLAKDADPAVKKRLENVAAQLRADIAARDELQGRAAKASLRLGAFLGRKLSDDSRAVNALAKLYQMRIDNGAGDDPRTKEFKTQLDAEETILADNLRYYADTLIRTSDDYSGDVLRAQKEILLVELEAMGLIEMKPFVEKHLVHIDAYRQDRKVARQQWLADWNKMQRQ